MAIVVAVDPSQNDISVWTSGFRMSIEAGWDGKWSGDDASWTFHGVFILSAPTTWEFD